MNFDIGYAKNSLLICVIYFYLLFQYVWHKVSTTILRMTVYDFEKYTSTTTTVYKDEN